jgi:hypothetical protein
VELRWTGVELPFSDKKIILRNTKQGGTDGSSGGILSISQKRKTSECSSEPFFGREKPFHSEPFSEEKKLGIPFRTIFRRENTWKSIANHFWEQKILKKRWLLLAVS